MTARDRIKLQSARDFVADLAVRTVHAARCVVTGCAMVVIAVGMSQKVHAGTVSQGFGIIVSLTLSGACRLNPLDSTITCQPNRFPSDLDLGAASDLSSVLDLSSASNPNSAPNQSTSPGSKSVPRASASFLSGYRLFDSNPVGVIVWKPDETRLRPFNPLIGATSSTRRVCIDGWEYLEVWLSW